MAQPLPSFARTTLAMAALYLKTLLRGRKTWLVLVLVVVGLGLAASVATLTGERRLRSYDILVGQLTLGFMVQFCALFYGTAVVREEVESRTLTYLLVRPIRRRSLLLGRWLAALLVVLSLTLAFSAITHVLAAPPEPAGLPFPGADLLDGLLGTAFDRPDPPVMSEVLLATGLSAVYYTTAFTAIAVLLPRPFLFGLGYIIFWEFALPVVPNAAATLSLKFHALNLVGIELPAALPIFQPISVTTQKSVAVFAITTVVLLAVAMWVFPKREYLLARAGD